MIWDHNLGSELKFEIFAPKLGKEYDKAVCYLSYMQSILCKMSG